MSDGRPDEISEREPSEPAPEAAAAGGESDAPRPSGFAFAPRVRRDGSGVQPTLRSGEVPRPPAGQSPNAGVLPPADMSEELPPVPLPPSVTVLTSSEVGVRRTPPPLMNPMTGEPIVPKSARSQDTAPPSTPEVAPPVYSAPPRYGAVPPPPPAYGAVPPPPPAYGAAPPPPPAYSAPPPPPEPARQSAPSWAQQQPAAGPRVLQESELPPPEEGFGAPPPPQSVVPPVAIMGAAGAGAVGAAAWAIIALVMGIEWSVIAWAIGGGIGYASMMLGGRGRKMGLICALIAFAALVGGRIGAVGLAYADDQGPVSELSRFLIVTAREEYSETLAAAVAYGKVEDMDELKDYMISYGFVDTMDPSEVSDEAIGYFEREVAPELRSFAEEYPDFETYAQKKKLVVEPDTWDVFFIYFGPLDLLFLFLGITTAFGVGGARDGEL